MSKSFKIFHCHKKEEFKSIPGSEVDKKMTTLAFYFFSISMLCVFPGCENCSNHNTDKDFHYVPESIIPYKKTDTLSFLYQHAGVEDTIVFYNSKVENNKRNEYRGIGNCGASQINEYEKSHYLFKALDDTFTYIIEYNSEFDELNLKLNSIYSYLYVENLYKDKMVTPNPADSGSFQGRVDSIKINGRIYKHVFARYEKDPKEYILYNEKHGLIKLEEDGKDWSLLAGP